MILRVRQRHVIFLDMLTIALGTTKKQFIILTRLNLLENTEEFSIIFQDLALARDLQDRMSMGRAYCNLGLAHSAIGNLENALECQKYFLGWFINPLHDSHHQRHFLFY